MALRDPDIRLMLRVRDDDPAAFAELVGNYQHRLVGIMHHLVGNAEEAEDLAQDALRNRGRKPVVPLEVSESGPLGARPEEQLARDHGATPSFGLRQAELADRIRAALDTLNERQKMAVVLNKFEDMNYAEIAEVMGLSTKAVKSLLSRARARLRDVLQPYVCMDEQLPHAVQGESDED